MLRNWIYFSNLKQLFYWFKYATQLCPNTCLPRTLAHASKGTRLVLCFHSLFWILLFRLISVVQIFIIYSCPKPISSLWEPMTFTRYNLSSGGFRDRTRYVMSYLFQRKKCRICTLLCYIIIVLPISEIKCLCSRICLLPTLL